MTAGGVETVVLWKTKYGSVSIPPKYIACPNTLHCFLVTDDTHLRLKYNQARPEPD